MGIGSLLSYLSTLNKKESRYQHKKQMIVYNDMNIIEEVQKKYFKGFYEGRYAQRKKLALEVK